MPERTAGRIARVRKRRLAIGHQRFIELGKVGEAEKHLAANLNQFGMIAAGEQARNRLDGQHVGGDIFANLAVTAGGSLNQAAVLIAQADREPVDFRFTEVLHSLAHSLRPGAKLFKRERIVETQHRLEVLDRLKHLVNCCTDRCG